MSKDLIYCFSKWLTTHRPCGGGILCHVIILLISLSSLLSSCIYDDTDSCNFIRTAQVRIPVDWTHFKEEQPTGMTVALYPYDLTQTYKAYLSNDLSHVDALLQQGSYHVLVYNQSTTEFGSLHFEGMENFSTAKVMANNYVSTWYKSRGDADRTAKSPEWLATGGIDSIAVTKQMVNTDSIYSTDTISPLNIIYKVNIHVKVKGIYNIRSARASLEGMAEGYVFSTKQPTSSAITQLIEQWSLKADKDNPANGVLSATIQSFGLPFGHQGLATDNSLRLSLLLVDNKTQQDYEFEVGDKFNKEEDSLNLDLDLEIDTPIPDVKPEGGSSGGFDATVEDWGDDINIDIDA